VLDRIAPDRAEGLTITAIDVALASAVRTARAQGATLIVAVIDSTSAEAFAMSREMPADARPDLLLLAHEGADMLFARPASVRPALARHRREAAWKFASVEALRCAKDSRCSRCPSIVRQSPQRRCKRS